MHTHLGNVWILSFLDGLQHGVGNLFLDSFRGFDFQGRLKHKRLPRRPPCIHGTQVAVVHVDDRWTAYGRDVSFDIDGIGNTIRHGGESLATQLRILQYIECTVR